MKDLQPEDVRDFDVTTGDVQFTPATSDIEDINKRAEKSVSDYKFRGDKSSPGASPDQGSGGPGLKG
jgi:hypothetical protein